MTVAGNWMTRAQCVATCRPVIEAGCIVMVNGQCLRWETEPGDLHAVEKGTRALGGFGPGLDADVGELNPVPGRTPSGDSIFFGGWLVGMSC